ncbi:hypothetical protein MJG53_007843 [Ovis ammon polii x Ovis aries]|uniref:Uncharacterized protein n=1 Tax=Ovis ammon polii x Ovis aries TaxID=2918886 RepID=A0ACB9V473_9CETA|nr:hypothetical protein MJG53_007843 [Ovis ammon polii x Ovis aries]
MVMIKMLIPTPKFDDCISLRNTDFYQQFNVSLCPSPPLSLLKIRKVLEMCCKQVVMEFIEEYITQKYLNMFREEKRPPCFELLLQNDNANEAKPIERYNKPIGLIPKHKALKVFKFSRKQKLHEAISVEKAKQMLDLNKCIETGKTKRISTGHLMVNPVYISVNVLLYHRYLKFHERKKKDFLLSSFKKKSALFITMTLDPPSLKTAWLSAAESDKVKFLLLSKSFNKFVQKAIIGSISWPHTPHHCLLNKAVNYMQKVLKHDHDSAKRINMSSVNKILNALGVKSSDDTFSIEQSFGIFWRNIDMKWKY